MSTRVMDIIRSRANLCLEFRDALTNQIIEVGRVEVRLWQNHMPFVFDQCMKKKRFLLLRGIEQGQIEIMAKAEGYEEKSCTVLIENNRARKQEEAGLLSDYVYTDIGMPVLSLCLWPGERYPLPKSYARRCMQGKPFELIRAVMDDGMPLVLLEEYQGGNILRFSAGEKVVGGVYRIQGKDGKFEDFAAVTWQEKEQMLLGAGLSGHYSRGSRLYFLYEAVADVMGNAFVICRERRER